MVISVLLYVFAFTACQESDSHKKSDFKYSEVKNKYDVEDYFPGNLKDTLLTNMVTYIYKRPAVATQETRVNPEFRSYYVKHTDLFTYEFHHQIGETHYFYLIRPARSLEGTARGVGGKFTTDETLELITFEEVFNTTIMDENQLREIGYELFLEMIEGKATEEYLIEHELVEWPDNRLKYHLEKREWRYVD